MKKHTKIYFQAFKVDYDEVSGWHDCLSEISESPSQDIHHIIGRGKSGEDRIENLMALTRKEHVDYGDKVEYMVMLLKIHRGRLAEAGVEFDNKWFEEKIKYYE